MASSNRENMQSLIFLCTKYVGCETNYIKNTNRMEKNSKYEKF